MSTEEKVIQAVMFAVWEKCFGAEILKTPFRTRVSAAYGGFLISFFDLRSRFAFLSGVVVLLDVCA